jgi:hypothetical protein
MRTDARRISRRYQGGEPRCSFRKSTGCSSPPAAIRANRRPFGYFALRRELRCQHRERSSSVNYGGPALVTNGDYLTIRANPLENNLVLWKFEKGKRSSVTWIRNTPDAHPSLFFPAMLHTDSIITAAGLPRMSFQAGLLDLAAYFAIVRLLGPCSVGAVYKKH